MYLKRLEIVGFKSFAEKTDLNFAVGITAVVGPNGSGKSNLSEAIRWVLGESNARELRGTRMEDIIFSGTEARRPVGYAQVAVTFDNADGALKVPYAELTVTRRMDRTGSSEYFINQSPCRLRDVQDLFLDTGVGKENYSFIGQGRIDHILTSRPEERRALVEEASGVSRYKQRKKEATRKLEDTEQNLQRLGDLMAGLREQLETLSEQSVRARRFQELEVEWRDLETGIAATAMHDLQVQARELSDRQQDLQQRLRQVELDLADGEQALDVARQLAGGLDAEVETVQAALVEATAAVERAEGRVNLLSEQEQRLAAEAERVARESAALAARLAALGEEQTQLAAHRAAVLQRHQGLTAELAAAEDEWAGAQAGVRELDGQAESLRQQAFSLAHQVAEARNAAAAADRSREQTQQRLARIAGEVTEAEARHNEATDRCDTARRMVTQRTEEAAAQSAALMAAQAAERTAAAQVQAAAQAQGQVRERLEGLRSRLALLNDMRAEFEGYQKGPRTVLQARDGGAAWSSGVHGAVAELVRTERTHERAIEVALGGAAQYLVTADEATAKDCIRELKNRSAGRATFLPLDVVSGRDFTAAELADLRRLPGVVDCALDLVTFDPKLRPAIAQLLGRVLVCQDMDSALAVGRRTGFRHRIVTLEGEVLAPGGAITGGSWGGRGTGLISRERQRAELENEVARLEGELASRRAEVAAAARAREQAVADTRTAQEGLAAAQVAVAEAQGAVSRLEQDVERWQQLLRGLGDEVAILEVESATGTEDGRRHAHAAEELRVRQELLQEQLAAALRERDGRAAAADRQGQAVSDLRVRLAETGQEDRSLAGQVQRLEAEVAAVRADVARREEERRRLLAQAAQADQEAQSARSELVAARSERQQRAASASDLHGRRMRALEEATAHERRLRGLRRIQGEVTAQLTEAEVETARVRAETAALAERVLDRLGLAPADLVGRGLSTGDLEEARLRVADLRAQIDALGPVYLGAIIEFEEADQRWSFLANQKQDLEEAKASLYRAIDELDRRIRTQFMDGFEAVRREFQGVFRELFEGGRADLVLLDPDKVLESGLDIMVQPPGRKMTHLGLLSGGERTLCAIALLFAVLRVRPTPFVILDEVEAALDEANVQRFGRYLRRMSDESQFICVTHQRGTMEAADVLYGVTMEGTGVSRMVSVRLTDLVETAS